MRRLVSVIDPVTNELVTPTEYSRRCAARRGVRGVGPMVVPDFAPSRAFRSPIDGTLITSREDRRRHNERHDVEDVGNDPAFAPGAVRKPDWAAERADDDELGKMIHDVLTGDRPLDTGRGEVADSFADGPTGVEVIE